MARIEAPTWQPSRRPKALSTASRCICFVFLCCLLVTDLSTLAGVRAAPSGVLAIDAGTDSTKAVLIKPGVPFDVVLNKDSKRKTSSIVTLRVKQETVDGAKNKVEVERFVGGDAASLVTRFPKDTYPSTKFLLGRTSESDIQVALYQKLFRLGLKSTHRNTLGYTPSDALVKAQQAVAEKGEELEGWLPEEIMAMLLKDVQSSAQAITSDKERIEDVVITVPAHYNPYERKAMLDAAEVARLKPLGLINDGTAVAINFAMTRTFPVTTATEEEVQSSNTLVGEEYHLFYDAGAGSVRATVVGFSTLAVKDHPTSKTTRNATSLNVRGIGWDRSAGGLAIEARLRDIFVGLFDDSQSGKPSVANNDRAMAKLLKEANRVKHVLSANGESQVRIEGLVDDIDFKSRVERSQLESLSEDLVQHFAGPIEQALLNANITLADLTSFVLVGGTSRVPLVQAAVKSIVPEALIAQNLNADEAAVMGAALYGAGKSGQFKTKDIRVRDLTPFDYYALYQSAPNESGHTEQIKDVLFPAGTPLGMTKTLEFAAASDAFTIKLGHSYASSSGEPGGEIMTATIRGFEKALVNVTEEEIANSTVRVTVQLSDSNVVTIPSAMLFLPMPPIKLNADDSLGAKLKGLLGGKDKEKNLTDDPEIAKMLQDAIKPKKPTMLTVDVKYATVLPMLPSDRIKSRTKLSEIDAAESRKKAKEEARNVLESLVYRVRDHLEDAAFVRRSTQAERDSLSKVLASTSDWMSDEAETASLKDLKTHRHTLEKPYKVIIARVDDARERPRALADLQAAISQGRSFIKVHEADAIIEAETDTPPRYTSDELTSIGSLLNTTETWLSETSEKQDKLELHDDPLLRRVDLDVKTKEIHNELTKLLRKPKPKAKKRKAKPTQTQPEAANVTQAQEPVDTTPEADKEPVRDEL
ncbi:uncharacterized protein L969DRAFT_95608 [Mixia osmundae IAM 14324]|uniref:Actin-like ATPase domain-containing protein n=1 Tax=Mixia osmundae (strain CBS 9802 / IAM 14324 / JCM 22182 / KY 12970) TaxID=764103 RepID=G7E7X1_MIXOS|nr:uncharacterized protein L969DRAFT_95608 [Mixia osmundae IAM 14324]KEI38532.1 hypothetical protein L969DRAFT_95608 [Mixia osmundae IAM 14324]GAA98931.1 hypothetical protein E5Q_05619 [Mixia osmundae IAM 14324]